jgi:hypothetical protein
LAGGEPVGGNSGNQTIESNNQKRGGKRPGAGRNADFFMANANIKNAIVASEYFDFGLYLSVMS